MSAIYAIERYGRPVVIGLAAMSVALYRIAWLLERGTK